MYWEDTTARVEHPRRRTRISEARRRSIWVWARARSQGVSGETDCRRLGRPGRWTTFHVPDPAVDNRGEDRRNVITSVHNSTRHLHRPGARRHSCTRGASHGEGGNHRPARGERSHRRAPPRGRRPARRSALSHPQRHYSPGGCRATNVPDASSRASSAIGCQRGPVPAGTASSRWTVSRTIPSTTMNACGCPPDVPA